MEAVKFSEKINIEVSQKAIFDYTQDYSKRLSWDTFLRRAELIGGATTAGIGVKAYCVARNGLGMETQYVSFNSPKVTAIKMTKGPFFFKRFLGSWTFKELTRGTTEVTFLYSIELKFPFNLLTNFIRRNLQNNVRQRLLDLKTCIENLQTPNSALAIAGPTDEQWAMNQQQHMFQRMNINVTSGC